MRFVFPAVNPFSVDWTLKDSTGDPVNDATVTATLWSGRSRALPEDQPGTAVPGLTSLELDYVPASDGRYSAVSDELDTDPGGDFVLVVDAVRAAEPFGHWECPAVVAERS